METNIVRKKTREVQIGNKKIGAGNPILIQSMTNTKTEDGSYHGSGRSVGRN